MCAPGLRSRARARKKWRWNVVLRFPQFTIGTKDDAFLAEKARGKAEFRVDLSDIPLTHRRERIEVSAGIANDEDEKSDTRLRAIKQISDETAADVEGMLAALQEQIDLLERQIYGIPIDDYESSS